MDEEIEAYIPDEEIIVEDIPKVENIDNSDYEDEYITTDTDSQYNNAQEEFLKVTSIESNQEEALALIELTKDYIELENLYQSKQYILASELVNKIKKNKHLEYIEQKVNKISIIIENKISIINEINNIDGQIDMLITENKYEEAISLINNYLGQDLTEECLNKLNTLMSKVNDSKSLFF